MKEKMIRKRQSPPARMIRRADGLSRGDAGIQRHAWAFAVMGLVFCLADGAGIRAGAPDEVLERLSENAAGIETVDTRFVQEKHLAIMERTMTMHGRIFMAKPDRLAWHVNEPIRYVMVMDDETIRQWDSESGQQTVMRLDANPALQVAVSQMRQWFSGDYARLTSEYQITLEQDDPVVLSFAPYPDHAAAGYIERVVVRFTQDERYLAGIMIEEKGGDRTELRFEDTKLNQDIPAAAWELRPMANE